MHKEGVSVPAEIKHFEKTNEEQEHNPVAVGAAQSGENRPDSKTQEQNSETLMDFVNELMSYFDSRPVEVIPKTGKISAEQVWEKVLEKFPDAEKIIVCDFPIEESGEGKNIVGGLQFGNIINIDHHHDLPEMKRHISSTNLAIEWVRENGIAPDNYPVVINHLDTDSFLSACIVRGFMAPEYIYGEAAIAADHTGEANEIADFFNPMDQIKKEGNEKFRYILFNWLIHLIGDPKVRISKQTRSLLAQVVKDRSESKEMVESGKFDKAGSVYWSVMDKGLDSSFFPALLPDATVIATFYPNKSEIGGYKTKLRLGNAAPDGFDLLQLEIGSFDPNFGGRWNAGSNSRGGGTRLQPEKYIELLGQKTEELLEKLNATKHTEAES